MEGGTSSAPLRSPLMLSTGSTLLNLACTDTPEGGFLAGRYHFVVGDSASGKTFICMTCLAEATINPAFADYRLIYDNVEDGCLLDIPALFNIALAERIEPPAVKADLPHYSETVEEFYYHVDDALQDGRPFVYVLDSMDALTSEASEAKFTQQKKAFRKSEDAAGSYGDGKAKENSQRLRKVLGGLRKTGSILVIVAQTRDSLGFGWEKKTRSGGHALRFYATLEIWASIKRHIKRGVMGKDRTVGVDVAIRVRKNRVTGKTPTVVIPIHPSYGIDDLGSCVDYLVDEKWWKKSGQKIVAREFKISLTRAALIRHIEKLRRGRLVRRIVGRCWKKIEKACAEQNRRPKYE